MEEDVKNNGYTKIKNYLVTSSELDVFEFRILAYLISIQHKGVSYPSITTLMNNLGFSKATVIRKLKSLEGQQFILRENRTIGTGKKTSNQYLINEDAISRKMEESVNTQVSDEVECEISEDELKIMNYDWLNEGI